MRQNVLNVRERYLPMKIQENTTVSTPALKTTVPKLTSWKGYGEYFGYPSCCIQAFEKLEHLGDPSLSSRPLAGTGFVPCQPCGEFFTDHELLAIINANRQHPTPLKPYDGG